MAPQQPGGKADALATLTGDVIPSAFVEPAQHYLHDREISALVDVGALDETALAVAERADGIIDALPTNGRLDVEELVRLEESPYFDLLFPEEQAALPTLWPLLAVPEPGADPVMFDDIEPLGVVDLKTPPGTLTVPERLAIADFAASSHKALKRLQLLHDDDDDATTVAPSDLEAVLAQPGPFTPAEIEIFEDALAEFTRRAESSADARAAVPAPGMAQSEIDVAGASLRRTVVTTYLETRRAAHHSEQSWGQYSFATSFLATRTIAVQAVLEAGQALLMTSTADGSSSLHRPDSSPTSTASGVYVMELWQDGERVSVQWADVPEMRADEDYLTLHDWLNHELETTAGVPLIRNIESTRIEADQWSIDTIGTFTYDLEPKAVPSDVSEEHLQALEDPIIAAPPGRYVFDTELGPVLVDVYPQGAVFVSHDGWRERLNPGMLGSSPADAKTMYGSGGVSPILNVWLDPDAATIRIDVKYSAHASGQPLIIGSLNGANRSG